MDVESCGSRTCACTTDWYSNKCFFSFTSFFHSFITHIQTEMTSDAALCHTRKREQMSKTNMNYCLSNVGGLCLFLLIWLCRGSRRVHNICPSQVLMRGVVVCSHLPFWTKLPWVCRESQWWSWPRRPCWTITVRDDTSVILSSTWANKTEPHQQISGQQMHLIWLIIYEYHLGTRKSRPTLGHSCHRSFLYYSF